MNPPEHVGRDVLSALVDGECGPEERKWAHDHIASCDECRRAASAFSSVQGLVGGLPPLVAPQDFVASVLDVRGGAVRSMFRGWRGRVAVAAACLGVAVSLAGLAVPPERAEPPVSVFMTRHVGVNDASGEGGQLLFAVPGR